MTGAAREKYTDLLLALSMLNSIGNELVKSGEGTGLVLGGTDERDSLLENRSLDGGASNVVKNILTSVGADSITTSVESSLLSNVDLVKTRNGLLAGSVVSLEGVSRGGSSVGLNESLVDISSNSRSVDLGLADLHLSLEKILLGSESVLEVVNVVTTELLNSFRDLISTKNITNEHNRDGIHDADELSANVEVLLGDEESKEETSGRVVAVLLDGGTKATEESLLRGKLKGRSVGCNEKKTKP
jgi:hypothetical protein